MTEKGDNFLQCYNRGCGQQFNPEKNTPESCVYHPGTPVFHDAYKGWSCCNKKTTDFTDFLNIKGCTKSYHSNVKPPEPEKPKKEEIASNKDEIYTYEASPLQKPLEALQRPNEDTPMARLHSTIGCSLKPLLEKLKQKTEQDAQKAESNSTAVAIGTSCKNGGCRQTYQGEVSDTETCLYHPGLPIFHEGMKYWSCCIRKTSDFNSFLEQVGCTTGCHTWTKKKDSDEKKIPCRYDWHQTGSTVVVSVYSKMPIPELSYVEANPVKLHMYIVFGEDKNVFDLELILFGVVDLEKSSTMFLGSKVEIKLKKVEPFSWNKLTLPVQKKTQKEERNDDLNDVEVLKND